MIRVLQVLGSTNLGGAESRMMDIYRHIDRERIQFDFLITEGNSGHFTPEIESLGGHVYTVPAYRVYNHKQYIEAVRTFFEEHKGYKAVHGHMTSTAAIYLPIAKKSGVPLTIAHARSAGVDSGIKGKVTKLLRKHLSDRCDMMLACSDLAAIAVFGEESYADGRVKIIPNAIAPDDYRIDEIARAGIRKDLQVDDKFVIGHVGRFHEAKNHGFLLESFAEFVKLRQDAVLVIVGDGALRAQIEEKIHELKLEGKVILTGNKSPVAPYYQTFDVFLFPSLFEGMPGTVVEAQAACVKSLISDAITRQVKVTDLVEFYSLSQTAAEWASKLYSMYGDMPVDRIWQERMADADDIMRIMSDTDVNVNKQVEYYTSLYEEGKR